MLFYQFMDYMKTNECIPVWLYIVARKLPFTYLLSSNYGLASGSWRRIYASERSGSGGRCLLRRTQFVFGFGHSNQELICGEKINEPEVTQFPSLAVKENNSGDTFDRVFP